MGRIVIGQAVLADMYSDMTRSRKATPSENDSFQASSGTAGQAKERKRSQLKDREMLLTVDKM